jgi:hypothetical protein
LHKLDGGQGMLEERGEAAASVGTILSAAMSFFLGNSVNGGLAACSAALVIIVAEASVMAP